MYLKDSYLKYCGNRGGGNRVANDGRWKLQLHMGQVSNMTMARSGSIVAVCQYVSFTIQVLVLLCHASVEWL